MNNQSKQRREISDLPSLYKASEAYAEEIGCKQFYVEHKIWGGATGKRHRWTVTFYNLKGENPGTCFFMGTPQGAFNEAKTNVEKLLNPELSEVK